MSWEVITSKRVTKILSFTFHDVNQAKDNDNNKTSLNKVDDPDNFMDEAS